ncbi:MAG: hypothetical protein MJ191_06845, partial [Clostridium sp.]|nr:hypothetical protein [Clostridium sp.]
MKCKSKQFKIVIEKFDIANDKTITPNDLENYFIKYSSAFKFYSFIEHNMDNSSQHYHIVIVTYNEYAESTILNDLVKELDCNKFLISVRVSRDLVHDIRYLTHKDDYSKAQYTDDLIYTSNIVDYQDICYKKINIFDLDFNSLYEICKENSYIVTLIYSQIGLSLSQKYRNVINDIVKEHREQALFKIKNDKKGEIQ